MVPVSVPVRAVAWATASAGVNSKTTATMVKTSHISLRISNLLSAEVPAARWVTIPVLYSLEGWVAYSVEQFPPRGIAGGIIVCNIRYTLVGRVLTTRGLVKRAFVFFVRWQPLPSFSAAAKLR